MPVSRYFPFLTLTLALSMILSAGCGSGTGTIDDFSASGSVAAALGGAYNGSVSAGTMAFLEDPAGRGGSRLARVLDFFLSFPDALAATDCPVIGSYTSGCTPGSNMVTMSLNNCSYGSSAATWSGTETISATGISCGAWPSMYSGNIQRQFNPSATRTSASGQQVTLDSTGAVTAANGATYSGGTTMAFSSGTPTSLAIGGLDLVGSSFSHTVTTTGGSALTVATNETLGGRVIVYHNLLKIQGTATVNVGFSAGCCTPTSGTISTVFSQAGSTAPTGSGSNFIGQTETLTFTGCGTATYSGPENEMGSVSLGNCF